MVKKGVKKMIDNYDLFHEFTDDEVIHLHIALKQFDLEIEKYPSDDTYRYLKDMNNYLLNKLHPQMVKAISCANEI